MTIRVAVVGGLSPTPQAESIIKSKFAGDGSSEVILHFFDADEDIKAAVKKVVVLDGKIVGVGVTFILCDNVPERFVAAYKKFESTSAKVLTGYSVPDFSILDDDQITGWVENGIITEAAPPAPSAEEEIDSLLGDLGLDMDIEPEPSQDKVNAQTEVAAHRVEPVPVVEAIAPPAPEVIQPAVEVPAPLIQPDPISIGSATAAVPDNDDEDDFEPIRRPREVTPAPVTAPAPVIREEPIRNAPVEPAPVPESRQMEAPTQMIPRVVDHDYPQVNQDDPFNWDQDNRTARVPVHQEPISPPVSQPIPISDPIRPEPPYQPPAQEQRRYEEPIVQERYPAEPAPEQYYREETPASRQEQRYRDQVAPEPVSDPRFEDNYPTRREEAPYMRSLSEEDQRTQRSVDYAQERGQNDIKRTRNTKAKAKTFYITGSRGGVGKTTFSWISANTTAAAVKKSTMDVDSSVYLLETDYRNPKLQDYLGIPSDKCNFGNIADEIMSIKESGAEKINSQTMLRIIKKNSVYQPDTGLYIIPCPYNVSKHAKEYIEYAILATIRVLRGRPGYIFIDSGTLTSSEYDRLDALVIGQCVDKAIVVTWPGETSGWQRACNIFTKEHGFSEQNVSLFLNRADRNQLRDLAERSNRFNIIGHFPMVDEIDGGNDKSAWVGEASDRVFTHMMNNAGYALQRFGLSELEEYFKVGVSVGATGNKGLLGKLVEAFTRGGSA